MPPKCLIADDSLYARMVVKDVIRRIHPSAEFHETSSGKQTLEAAEAEGYQFDWYLLDINMSPPDGVETSKILMERGVPASRIALVTGNRSVHLMEEASGLGVQFINKAISPDDVDPFADRLRSFFDLG